MSVETKKALYRKEVVFDNRNVSDTASFIEKEIHSLQNAPRSAVRLIFASS